MTHKNYLPLLFYSLLSIVFCLLAGCYIDKPIVVSESLKNSSERWEAKVRGGISSIGRARFGPYNTVSSKKLDSPKLKSFDYQFSLFFRSNETRKKRTVFSIVVSQNLDSARVNFSVWQTTTTSSPGLFTILRDDNSHKYKDAEGEIYMESDTPVCVFKIQSMPVSTAFMDLSSKTSGYMICYQDTIKISYIGEFNDGRKGLGHVIKIGISLENHEGQVAVLQTEMENNVWISKDLPSKTRLAIATFFCAVLGTKDL